MRLPKILLGLLTLATLATGTVAVGTPAQAEQKPTVIELETRDGSIAVQDVRNAIERSTGEWIDGPHRAVVVTDTSAELTREQVEALLAGKDAGEVRVLRTFDRVPVDSTLDDLGEGVDAAAQTIVAFRDVVVVVIIRCTPRSCTILIIIWW